MFNFVIKTQNVDGVVTIREFHTASCFLAACEDDTTTFLHDLIVSVYYGGATVNTSQFDNVYDLYLWMCSDACDWF